MFGFVSRRLVHLVPVLLAVTLLTFLLASLLPGDLAVAMLGDQATPERVSPILHLRLTPVESWNSKSSTRFILIGAADWR